MTVRNAIKTVLFTALLMLIVAGLNWIFTPGLGSSNPWPAVIATRGQADVLLMGSSHTYVSVLPMEMWRRKGIAALDVAGSAQIMRVTDQYLQEVLKYQRPRVVMLEVYMLGKQNPPVELARIRRAHHNLDYMPWGLPRLRGIVRSHDPSHWSELLFPLQAYHSRWMTLGSSDFDLPNDWRFVYARGAEYRTGTKKIARFQTFDEVAEAEYSEDLPYVRHIARTCREHGITLVLYVTPSSKIMEVGDAPVLSRLRGDLGRDYPEVKYLDLNHADGLTIDSNVDFKDEWGHLNFEAAKKLSIWLADYLSSELNTPDRRSAAFAEDWNRALERYDAEFSSSQVVAPEGY